MSWDPRKWDPTDPPKQAWILLLFEFLICLGGLIGLVKFLT